MPSQLYFRDSDHCYFDEDGKIYESVSGVSKKIFKKFRSEFSLYRSAYREFDEQLYVNAKKILRDKVKKNPGLYPSKSYWNFDEILPLMRENISDTDFIEIEKIVDRLKLEWKEKGDSSTEYGTKEHSMYESKAISDGYVINRYNGLRHRVIARETGDGYDNKYILQDVLKYKENIYLPEAIVGSFELGIWGQIDKFWLRWNGMHHVATIGDYKSDEQMDMRGFGNGMNLPYETMPYPFNNFQDCNFHKYTVKMNIYSYLSELCGVRSERLYIQRIPKDQEVSYISLPNYRSHIIDLIDLHQKNSL